MNTRNKIADSHRDLATSNTILLFNEGHIRLDREFLF
jgi:hypothetical protein